MSLCLVRLIEPMPLLRFPPYKDEKTHPRRTKAQMSSSPVTTPHSLFQTLVRSLYHLILAMFLISMMLCCFLKSVSQKIFNRRSYFRFFKTVLWLFQNIFFKMFFKLFFSLRLGKAALQIICRFLPQFLQGFPPSKPVRPFYPSFWFYFHVSMHIFMHLKGIFGPPWIRDFCWFKANFLKLIIGFCWDIVIFMIVVD